MMFRMLARNDRKSSQNRLSHLTQDGRSYIRIIRVSIPKTSQYACFSISLTWKGKYQIWGKYSIHPMVGFASQRSESSLNQALPDEGISEFGDYFEK